MTCMSKSNLLFSLLHQVLYILHVNLMMMMRSLVQTLG